MLQQPKTISADDHLRALALFTLAHQYYLKMRELELGLAKLLPGDDDELDQYYRGLVSDALYSDQTNPDFDLALKREGYLVEPR